MKQLTFAGIKVTHNAENIKNGTVIINTCGFIKDAKQESIDTMLQFAQAKIEGKIQNLFVIGCLSELYKKDLVKEVPEVDQFFGVNNFEDILKKIGAIYQKDLLNERVQTTPQHFAYLKISEGCDRSCAFCSIPTIRGKHISLPIEELAAEAQKLALQGVKELILIAQDLTYYGLDIYKEQKLADLLNELVKVEGIEWIRLHYAYPHKFPENVIDVMKTNPKICRYLDIPFQHISDNVLKMMKRGNSKQQTYDLISKLRKEIPGIALRTTLLTGHPGETQADFDDLVEFVKQVKFDRLGIFPYSHEEHAYAFNHYQDEIPEKVKQERVEVIMQIQQQISQEINELKVGKELKVLIDRKEGDYWVGRTEFDSPEVDGEVLVTDNKKIRPGNFYQVKIMDASEFDLIGEVC
jgi:ribosomal protein S12 methylthiotransferase